MDISYEITGATISTGSDDASGEVFNLGISQVCYTITETTDPDSSGLLSSTCCFNVIVNDTEPPVVICPASDTIPNDMGLCTAEYTWTHPDTADNCGVTSLEIAYQNPDGSIEGPDAVMPGSSASRTFELGETQITYIATDNAGNTSSCSWSLTVEDTEDPMISCIGDTTVYADANCAFLQLTDGFDPLISDNCPELSAIHDYLLAPNNNTLAGSGFELGTTTITWTLTDAAGNSSSCSYVITVLDTIAPAFVNCPTDTLIIGTDVDNCTAFVNFSTPIAEDNCDVTVSQITGPTSGSTLDPGFYTVQFLAIDASNNTDTCALCDPCKRHTETNNRLSKQRHHCIGRCRCMHVDKSCWIYFPNDIDG